MNLLSNSTDTAAERMAWFRAARFGMFIHWGVYSQVEHHEWAFKNERIPPLEYQALAEKMHPETTAPREWAALAKRAGAGYVVFTTKHHDGFCLWDTATTAFSSTHYGARRDYVREVVDAVRAEGLKVGLYYSIGDWHVPAYAAVARGDAAQVPVLQEYLRAHLRELLGNYGKIDMLWYDGAWFNGRYLTEELLGSAELNALARSLQPRIVINPRSGPAEDFDSCENELVPAPRGRDWEMCTCINDIWGYCRHDYNYKTVNQLLFLLVNCAVQGGNLLLNIGPDGHGIVPPPQVERLEAIGQWLARHRESICATERLSNPFTAFGRITRKNGRLYLHNFYWPGSRMVLAELTPEQIGGPLGATALNARVLTSGEECTCHWDNDNRLIITGLPETPPDTGDTVLVLEKAPS